MRGRPPFSDMAHILSRIETHILITTCDHIMFSHLVANAAHIGLPIALICQHSYPSVPSVPSLPNSVSYPCQCPSVLSLPNPPHNVSHLCPIFPIACPILASHFSPYLGADRVTGRSRSVLLVRTQKTRILSGNGRKAGAHTHN